MNIVTIWALRWSVGYGWRWIPQRRCSEAELAEWLPIFQKDEPNVQFKAQKTRPKICPK